MSKWIEMQENLINLGNVAYIEKQGNQCIYIRFLCCGDSDFGDSCRLMDYDSENERDQMYGYLKELLT